MLRNVLSSDLFRRALLAMTLLLFVQVSLAHQQHVHQYVVTEAYLLLRHAFGDTIPPRMHDHVGGLTPFFAGDSAWQRPYMTTGAWREDVEDVVFNYNSIFVPGIGNNYALTSITHFWDADDGDLPGNRFMLLCPSPPFPQVYIETYENAYDKFVRYALGDGNPDPTRKWTIRYPRSFTAHHGTNGHLLVIAPLPVLPFGIPISYDSLTGFVRSRVLHLLLPGSGAYTIFDINDMVFLNPHDVPQVVVANEFVDTIVWEVLGRMCHLLADMSVPAHAHRDEHGLRIDDYENWMGDSSVNPYLAWNHQNVGSLIDPFTSDNDPLHYLMYTMQQQSDHFGSNGPCDGNGNNIVGGNPRPVEAQAITPAFLASLGNPTTTDGPWTLPNLENIRDKTFRYAIRATAGLLYWFGRVALDFPPLTSNGTAGPSVLPAGYALHQNYPNPFNPGTRIDYQIPKRSHVSLKIYDILGREVATLVDEVQEAGYKSVQWNAANVASGAYLCRFFAGGIAQTQKLILSK